MALWSNRVLILLGAVGLFITGVLSFATYNHLTVPCSGSMSCSFVLQSSYARFPANTGVSVSYLGFMGYLGLMGLAIARSLVCGRLFKRLALLGFVMAAIGTVFSLYLTYVSLDRLNQKCIWCLSSLGVILLMTIGHAALMQADEPENSDTPFGPAAASLLLLGALGFGVVWTHSFKEQIDMSVMLVDAERVPLEEILPIDAKVIGNPNARVTVIEFIDVNCGACREMYPKMKALVAKYDDLRIGFRSFPIVQTHGHETSGAAAAIAEYAADKDKFWAFMDEAMKPSNQERVMTLDGLISIAGEAGLSKGDIVTIFQSGQPEYKELMDSYWARVDADIKMGEAVILASTPTFLLYVEGEKGRGVSTRRIIEEVEKALEDK